MTAPPTSRRTPAASTTKGTSSSTAPCAPSDLETLRGECRRLVDERDAEMDRLGVDKLDLDHRGRRYFVHAYEQEPARCGGSCSPT